MPAPVTHRSVIPGDFSAAWKRVLTATQGLGLTVETSSASEGTLRARRRRLLSADRVFVHLEELETGEVEVRIDVEGGRWGNPADLARRMAEALR